LVVSLALAMDALPGRQIMRHWPKNESPAKIYRPALYSEAKNPHLTVQANNPT
jgi:hypothetical protein